MSEPYQLPMPIEQLCKQLYTQALEAPIKVKCKSHEEAKRLRQKMYRYRNKVLAKPTLAPRLAIASPGAQMKVIGKTFIIQYDKTEVESGTATE